MKPCPWNAPFESAMRRRRDAGAARGRISEARLINFEIWYYVIAPSRALNKGSSKLSLKPFAPNC